MKKLVIVVFMLVFSCTGEEETFCNSYCNDWLSSYQNVAEGKSCTISDIEVEEYMYFCEDNCQEAIYSMDRELISEVEACVGCIHSEVTYDSIPKDFDTIMRGSCQQECSFLGCRQFFTTFFVVEPNSEC